MNAENRAEIGQVHDQDINDGSMCLCGLPLADCDDAWED